jgi:hypothetical protein
MTTTDPATVTAGSGDSERHLTLEQIESGFAALAAAPKSEGRVAMLVACPGEGQRVELDSASLKVDGGMPGDRWGEQSDVQLTAMQLTTSQVIANGQPLSLFGDNLVLDLDLSAANMSAGTRVRIGEALLEVTPVPHNGCGKYSERFGDAALRLISRPEARDLHLRGIYFKVVEDGDVSVGDAVEVLR